MLRKRTQCHFLFSAIAGICVVFINDIASAQTLLNVGCIDGSRSGNRSRIHKFEKKIRTESSEQERSRV